MMIYFENPECYVNTLFVTRISIGNWAREDEKNWYVDIESAGESGGMRIMCKSIGEARKLAVEVALRIERESTKSPVPYQGVVNVR